MDLTLSLGLVSVVVAAGVLWFATRNAGGGGGGRPSKDEVAAAMRAGATVLDVRSAGEFASGHVDGARNLPVGELAGRLHEVPRDRAVIVYCQSGGRSARAAQVLKAAGYSPVLDGGGIGSMPR